MLPGDKTHSSEGNQIGDSRSSNNDTNGQLSNEGLTPVNASQNNLQSLNVSDQQVIDAVGNKPISDLNNLTYSNTKNNIPSSNKSSSRKRLLTSIGAALGGFIMLGGLAFGATYVVHQSNQNKKNTSINASTVSKTISIKVPQNANQAAVLYNQSGFKTITLNGDVNVQGGLNTKGDINTSGNISATGNLNVQGDFTIAGNIDTSGDITANSFSGDGANLTNLSADNITSGQIDNSHLSPDVTLLGQTIPLDAIQANIVSSINGLVNNGGNIDIVAGNNIDVSTDPTNNQVIISLPNGLGTITGVSVGAGLTGGGTSGNINVGLDNQVTVQGNIINGTDGLVKLVAGLLPVADGSNLTNLNASNLSSGTVANSLLSGNVTLGNNNFNQNNGLVQLNSNGYIPVLNGSNLTNLNASNLSSGTVANSRLSNNVTLQGNTFNGANQLLQVDLNGKLPVINGSNLTNLNASNLSSGTVADSRLSNNVCLSLTNNCSYVSLQGNSPAVQTGNINVSGTISATNLVGNIDASEISSGIINSSRLPISITYMGNSFNGPNQLAQLDSTGIINDQYLSSNVTRNNSSNHFTGVSNTFDNGIIVNSIQPSSSPLTVGSTSNSLNLQGSDSSTFSSTNSGHTTSIGFKTPTTPIGNVVYQFNSSVAAGTYEVCTTANFTTCTSGAGGGIAGSGTIGQLAVFDQTGSITSSSIKENTNNGNIDIGTVNSSNNPGGFQLNVAGGINTSDGIYVGTHQICDATGCQIGSNPGNSAITNKIGDNSPLTNSNNYQTANIDIQSANSTNVAAIIQGASNQNADLLDLRNYNGSYSAGTISQSGNNITGSGTNFTSSMSGGTITYPDSSTATITWVNATHLTSSVSKTVSSGSNYLISGLNQNVASVDASGNLNIVGNFKVNGAQISTSNLSNSSDVALQSKSANFTSTSSGAFEIQGTNSNNNPLFIANANNNSIAINANPNASYSLNVGGIVNATGFDINGIPICSISGSVVECAPKSGSNNYIQNSLSTTNYSAGTISQIGNNITGIGTNFTSSMSGGTITYPDSSTATITWVDSTHLTSSVSKTVSSSSNYVIGYTSGLQTANIKLASGSPTVATATFQGDSVIGSPQTANIVNINNSGGTTVAAFDSNGKLILGAQGSQTGKLVFNGKNSNSNSITITGPDSPLGNFTLSIPTITGNSQICTSYDNNCNYATSNSNSNGYVRLSPTNGSDNGDINVTGVIQGGSFNNTNNSFSVSSNGDIIGASLNVGGIINGQGGLAIEGDTYINTNNGSGNTNIGNGGNTGNVSIGNLSGALNLQGSDLSIISNGLLAGYLSNQAYAIVLGSNNSVTGYYILQNAATTNTVAISQSNVDNGNNTALITAPDISGELIVAQDPNSTQFTQNGNITINGTSTANNIIGTSSIKLNNSNVCVENQACSGYQASGNYAQLGVNNLFTGTTNTFNAINGTSIQGSNLTIGSYSTGKVTQSANTITAQAGNGTAFTSAMVGGTITINTTPTPTVETITAVPTSTTLTVSGPGTSIGTNTTYSISYGFKVDASGNLSTAGTYNGNTFTSSSLSFSGSTANISAATLNLNDNKSTNTTNIGTNGTSGLVTIGSSSNNVTIGAATTINSSASIYNNSASGFQVGQNSSSANIYLKVDNSSGIVTIGNSLANISVNNTTGNITFTGTVNSPHSKQIILSPEFAGAVLDSGSAFDQPNTTTIGTMTAGFDTTIGSLSARPGENNYSWTTSQGANQSYDVILQVPLPSDFNTFNNTTNSNIQIDTKGTSGSSISAWLWNNNSNESNWSKNNLTGCSLTVGSAWATQNTCALSAITDNSANGMMTFRVRLTAASNNGTVQLGNITINYTSKY